LQNDAISLEMPMHSKFERWYWPALIAIIIFAALLRVAGIFNDFWLDEIWSWQFAMSAHSAREILLGDAFHHDNNHVLNTLFIYALGDRHDWRAYRLMALVTGIGTIVITGALARRWGRTATIAAVILTGFSYFFVHFSSEARGYAPAAFFALLSFAILRRFVDETRAEAARQQETLSFSSPLFRGALFGLCYAGTFILGILSHTSFIYAFFGAVVWMPIALVRAGQRRPVKVAGNLLTLFFVPFLFLTWLYRTAIRGMAIGGGPSTPFPDLLAQTSAFALGLPTGQAAGWIGPAIMLLFAVAGAWILWREGSDEWIFLIVSGLVAPAAILCVRHEQLYPRYLFVALPFLALLAALALALLSARGRLGTFAATAILLFFVIGNALHISRFLKNGRGHYFAAVEFIATHTPEKLVRVGGYSEFRTTMLVNFYATRVPESGKQFIYIPDESNQPPEWYLSVPRTGQPSLEKLTLPQWKSTYRLEAEFPHYGLAGWDWALYHRVGKAKGP
jgi:hypothetical protein